MISRCARHCSALVAKIDSPSSGRNVSDRTSDFGKSSASSIKTRRTSSGWFTRNERKNGTRTCAIHARYNRCGCEENMSRRNRPMRVNIPTPPGLEAGFGAFSTIPSLDRRMRRVHRINNGSRRTTMSITRFQANRPRRNLEIIVFHRVIEGA